MEHSLPAGHCASNTHGVRTIMQVEERSLESDPTPGKADLLQDVFPTSYRGVSVRSVDLDSRCEQQSICVSVTFYCISFAGREMYASMWFRGPNGELSKC